MVESLALSRPEVGFFLRSDGRRSLALPAAADLGERISQVHGLSLSRSLIALADPVVGGFVSPLAVSFPTRRYSTLHVAVNGRVVEADSFAPAVAKAYADLLPKGRHPAAFLRLELGSGEVDVRTCTRPRAPCGCAEGALPTRSSSGPSGRRSRGRGRWAAERRRRRQATS